MKIVLVHNTYQQPGGEDVVFDQEKRMLDAANHRVVTYTRSNHEIGKLNVLGQIGMAKRTIWASDTRAEFDKLLDREKPDVVHVHNTFMLISPSIYSACRDHGVPVVQTLHNFRLLCPNSNLFRDNHVCEECVDDGLWHSIQHACYRDSRPATAAVVLMLGWHRAFKTWEKCISRYIALTNFAREKFIAAGLPADRMVVKPNFLESDPGSREQSGAYAVFIGRLSPDKGDLRFFRPGNNYPSSIHYRLSATASNVRNWKQEYENAGLTLPSGGTSLAKKAFRSSSVPAS